MPNKLHISHSDIVAATEKLLNEVLWSDLPSRLQKIKVYPVPRGGVPVAYALVAANNIFHRFSAIEIVNDPEKADMILDDLIDSGKTRLRFSKKYPHIPFYSLYHKKKGDSRWYIFPWEVKEKEVGGADDIPTRLLQFIGEDPNRGGLVETPKRYLKAWEFLTSGYNKDPKTILKVFEDGAENCDEMVLVKNIPVYSQCEHHLLPFFGVAHVAYIPDGKIVGLSKINRVVDMFARRLQVQERLTNQIAQTINDHLNPLGVAVVIEARHTCMEARGVCQQGHSTTTSSMTGVFKDQVSTRLEFLELIKQ